jgi:hypothetical protein
MLIHYELNKQKRNSIIKLMPETKKLIWIGLIIVIVLSSFSCAGQNPAKKQFEDNQRKWNNQKVGNYSYRLEVDCFCSETITRPVFIIVHAGIPLTKYADDGSMPTEPFFYNCDTIEKLFSISLNALQNTNRESHITYDDKFGFPNGISIINMQVFDDVVNYSIVDFRPL